MPFHTKPQRQPDSQSRKDDSDLLVAARAELAALQERYDALHADRDRLVQTLSERMKIWKRFKRWIVATKGKTPPKSTHCDEMHACGCSGPTPAMQQESVIKMLETPVTPTKPRLNRAGTIPSPTKTASPRKSPLSPNVSILNTPRKIRISSEGSPYKRHLKRKRDENGDTTVEEMSQTQEDSQALTFWQPSTPSQRERARRHSLSSCPPTPRHPPALHSPPPTKRPRRNAESTVLASTSTVTLPTISRYKSARGRDVDEPPALNAEFEIDPAANDGVPFAFDQVVRGRHHRHRLIAGECEECRGWYAAVGPLPPRLEAPRWNSPPSRAPSSPTLVASESAPSRDYRNSDERLREQEEEVSAHRQAVSRHRAHWERAPTPPGYWEIGFPDTQAVEKINERAAELHREKRAFVAKEAAKKVGGRYRRRAGGL